MDMLRTRSSTRIIAVLAATLATCVPALAQTFSQVSGPASNMVGLRQQLLDVTLAAPQSTPTTVTLSTSSPSIKFVVGRASTVVTTLTIPAGSTTTQATVRYNPAYVQHDAVVRVSTPTDTRIVHVGIIPTSEQQPLAALTAFSMPGQVLLNWECSLTSLSGATYNIYKEVNGAPTLLKEGWKEPFYVDTAASTASTKYSVEVVIPGVKPTTGSILDVYASADSGNNQAAATGIPTSTISGSFYVNVLGGLYGTVVVDGQIVGAAEPYSRMGSLSGSAPVKVDSSLLSNGQHKLQVFARNGDTIVASQEYTFTSSNAVRLQYNSGLSEPTVGNDVAIIAAFGASTSYQVDIVDNYGVTVRSSTGSGTSVNYYWDGNDSLGNEAESGSYTARLTANGVTQNIPIARMRSGPNFLALLSPVNDESANGVPEVDTSNTRLYARIIGDAIRQIQYNYGYYDAAIFVSTNENQNPAFKANLRRWMKNAKSFYYYGHMQVTPNPSFPNGLRSFIRYGGVEIYPDVANRYSAKLNPTSFTIDSIVDPDNPYNFVFLDTCSSAGGGMYVPPSGSNAAAVVDRVGPYNVSWRNAFNSDCFVGWNGLSGSNTTDDGDESFWFRYRKRLWNRLGQSEFVSRAFGYANGASLPASNIMPQDTRNSQGRRFQDGDTTLP